MEEKGFFIYKCVHVTYNKISGGIEMKMQGKTIIGDDFNDAFEGTKEYIDMTIDYYDKHGTN